jgi:Uma2 family endonuclease
MRLQLLSDVHVEFHADGGRDFVRSLDPEGVDVMVLAGDIAVGAGIVSALSLFCDRYRDATVVYVHGNHEFYGANRASVVGWTREALRGNRNLVWLDGGVVEVQGHRFIGGPLWFRHDPRAAAAKRGMADFAEIPGFESWVYEENARMLRLLESDLREGDIAVTHHLPTPQSVATRYVGNALNAFFLCDVEALIRERKPVLWMHGHTHASVRFQSSGATRGRGILYVVTQGAPTPGMDPQAFLAWERGQSERHVYFRGEVFAMAGGSPRHSRLAARIIARLDAALGGGVCDVHTSDLRLGLDDAHFVYADAVVVCRPLSFRPGTTDVVTNPRVVVEVLSRTTETYDRGAKQAGYLALASVDHFVLVSQREPRVEVYTRESDGSFRFRVQEAGTFARLEGLDVTISIDELYDGVFDLPGDDGAG